MNAKSLLFAAAVQDSLSFCILLPRCASLLTHLHRPYGGLGTISSGANRPTSSAMRNAHRQCDRRQLLMMHLTLGLFFLHLSRAEKKAIAPGVKEKNELLPFLAMFNAGLSATHSAHLKVQSCSSPPPPPVKNWKRAGPGLGRMWVWMCNYIARSDQVTNSTKRIQ